MVELRGEWKDRIKTEAAVRRIGPLRRTEALLAFVS